MARYIHQLSDWPKFHWDEAAVTSVLGEVRFMQGKIIGRMSALGFSEKTETTLRTLTEDVIKSTEIEGENLDSKQVRSSIARRLGLDVAGLIHSDRNVDGVVEMILDATQNCLDKLTSDRLWDWQSALFPSGRSGLYKIIVGRWRDSEKGPMQVVSGAMGKETVHFEAPDASRVASEMERFLDWFNYSPETDAVLKSAIAHFWFVTIHPFDDGNGRIARAIADMQLTSAEDGAQRFYSISAQIGLRRNEYYSILEKTQKGDLNITEWLKWYLSCLTDALSVTNETLDAVLKRTKFWDDHSDVPFNERQRSVISKLQDKFFGKMTSSKWAKIAKCSQDTAGRDIQDLISKGILRRESAGGRSTAYYLVW